MTQKYPNAKAVVIVHCGTFTTIINPMDEIGELLKVLIKLLIVDVVSSSGGIPYCMDEWGINLCASATQIYLGAPPGLAPVAVSEKAWS